MKKLKLHKDFDFIDHDKVFVENSDGTLSFYELYYEQEFGAWMMIPYTDKQFDKPLYIDGKIKSEFFYEYGFDLINRVSDYDFDEI